MLNESNSNQSNVCWLNIYFAYLCFLSVERCIKVNFENFFTYNFVCMNFKELIRGNYGKV